MSKNKYIDYGKLLEERYRLGLDEMSRISKVNAFNHFIDTLPLADVEEVRHGKWIKCEKEGGIFANYECSVCSAYPTGGIRSYYCPNCGAKMDKEMTEG